MKVAKAIEILTSVYFPSETPEEKDLKDAIKLGIAALTRHRNRDYTTYMGMHEPLVGETPPEKVDK